MSIVSSISLLQRSKEEEVVAILLLARVQYGTIGGYDGLGHNKLGAMRAFSNMARSAMTVRLK